VGGSFKQKKLLKNPFFITNLGTFFPKEIVFLDNFEAEQYRRTQKLLYYLDLASTSGSGLNLPFKKGQISAPFLKLILE
jgi:hypothetical protein